MESPEESTRRYFVYIPNVPLAIVSLIVFILFTIYLSVRIHRSRSRKFLYILPITALMEAIGYLIRILCSTGGTDLIKYIVMTFFLLLPPNALALVNYKSLGEVVRLSNVPAKFFFLRPKFITWFFFSSDIFSFMLQGSGGGLMASVESAQIGKTIALVGLAIQLFFFASFAFITVYVHKSPKYNYIVEGQTNPKEKMARSLYITLFFLYIRSIYRVAEFATDHGGVIAAAEWAFYVFDTLAIAISFVAYCIYFMGNYLPKRDAMNRDISSATISSVSSSDELTHAENDIEMRPSDKMKYGHNNA